jgi:hypothetical protein
VYNAEQRDGVWRRRKVGTSGGLKLVLTKEAGSMKNGEIRSGSIGKTVDTAKLIATDMPRVLRSEPGKRERDDTL